jgi:hypothetical protein
MKSMKQKKKRPVKALACALAFSAVVHTVGIYPKSLDYASRPFRAAASALYESYQSYKLNRERLQLLSLARAQIKKGKLRLGEFMLKANDIDAREQGEKPDTEQARKEYMKYKEALNMQIKSGKKVQEAFPKVFKKMKYYGIPSGRMVDALLDNGGSCEQLSHLSVSLLNDLGYKKQAHLRVYGANADGLSHVAPIFSERGREFDIVAGGISDGKGTKVPAAYLVEAYAKAHGLPFEEFKDPEERKGKGKSHGFAARSGQELTLPNGKPSGFSYPAAKDSYPGGAPLFAKRAFGPFSEQKVSSVSRSQSTGGVDDKHNSAKLNDLRPNVILGVRSVASAVLLREDDRITYPVVDTPSEKKITHISSLIEITKKRLKKKMGNWELSKIYGALCGLYRELEWNLRILGMGKLAEAAFEQRKKIVKLAKGPLSKLHNDKDSKPRRHWSWDTPGYLVYLGKDGEDALFKALENIPSEDWIDELKIHYNSQAIAYLIAARADMEKISKQIMKLSGEEKVQLLHSLDVLDFAGQEEHIKALRAYSEIVRRKETQMKREMMRGILHVGESLRMNNLYIRFDTLDKAGGGDKNVIIAILAIINSEKKIIMINDLQEGEKKTFYVRGRAPFDVKVHKIDPGYAFNAKWVDLRILSSGPSTFQDLVSAVMKECRNRKVSSEWEDAIIAASAMRKIQSHISKFNNQPNPSFYKPFYKWLCEKKGFDVIRLQVKSMFGIGYLSQ